MKVTPKQILLIDFIGALISTLFLAGVLPILQDIVGMPINVLYCLGAIAALISCHSFYSYKISSFEIQSLKRVMISNLFYTLLTCGLLGFFFRQMLLWGWVYFVLEILILTILVSFQKRIITVYNS